MGGRREQPLADGMVEPPAGEASDPEAQALLADSVAPGADGGARHPRPRRVAAARQRASRARRRVHGTAPPRPADLARQRQVVDVFPAALRDGDFGGLLAVLDPDVVFRDGSAAPPAGAPSLMRGARAVAGYALTYSRQARFVQPALVNRTSDPERLRHVDLAAARC